MTHYATLKADHYIYHLYKSPTIMTGAWQLYTYEKMHYNLLISSLLCPHIHREKGHVPIQGHF